MGDDTEDYLEDIKFQIDNIRSKIDEYLELRREDAPSEAGGSPWLLNRFMFGDANETAQLANNFSRMSTSNVQPPVPSTINQQSPGFTSTAMAAGTTTTFSNAPFANQNNEFYTR